MITVFSVIISLDNQLLWSYFIITGHRMNSLVASWMWFLHQTGSFKPCCTAVSITASCKLWHCSVYIFSLKLELSFFYQNKIWLSFVNRRNCGVLKFYTPEHDIKTPKPRNFRSLTGLSKLAAASQLWAIARGLHA